MKYALIISMLITISCSARIGETLEECAKRYGSGGRTIVRIAKKDYWVIHYKKGIYEIQALFERDEKICVDLYIKNTKNKFTNEQIKILLKPYGKFEDYKGRPTWLISKDKKIVVYGTRGSGLTITTKAYRDSIKDREAAEKARKVEAKAKRENESLEDF